MRGWTKRGLMLAILVGVVWAADRVGWCADAGADVWNLPALEAQLAETAARRKQLDDADGIVEHRLAVKEALIDELIVGRQSLADVAEQFRQMNQDRPESLAILTRNYQTDDLREVAVRNVLAYVGYRHFHSEAKREAAVALTHAQFRTLYPGANPVAP